MAAMSSCNAQPVSWAISPTMIGGKRSCNATAASWTGGVALSTGCECEISCNARDLLGPLRRQYPGFAFRQACTRATLSGPRKYSAFSGFCRQARWLAALLAARQSGLKQNCCRPRLRASGTKKSAQRRHLHDPFGCIAVHPNPARCLQHFIAISLQPLESGGRKTTHGKKTLFLGIGEEDRSKKR